MQLRDYQLDIIDRVRAAMLNGYKRILIQAPTGAGKTALTVNMLKGAAAKKQQSWFVNHRRELIRQSSKAFAKDNVFHGIVAANFQPDPRAPIQVCSIQTLVNRFLKITPPKFIVWDESRHIAAGSWDKIFKAFPSSFHVGLDATPVRGDGRGLGQYFQTMIQGPSVSWLIENKYLSPYKLFAPGGINTSKLHVRYGEFKQDELVSLVNRPSITGSAITEYKKKCFDRRALGFAVSVEHSKYVVEQFKSVGITAAHVDGETDPHLRDDTLAAFEEGLIKVVFNCQLFGEGVDLPAVEGLIDLAPTMSLPAYLQRCGRVLRICEGKENAIILDHSQNCLRHGLPDDEREWKLDGEGYAKNKKDEPGAKICPKCLGAQATYKTACSYCGHLFVTKAREVDQVAGSLEEVDLKALRNMTSIKAAMDSKKIYSQIKALEAIGLSRGYKRPALWARDVIAKRLAKKKKDAA